MHGQWLYSDMEQEYYSGKCVTPKERCGQIVDKEERGRQRPDECGTLR